MSFDGTEILFQAELMMETNPDTIIAFDGGAVDQFTSLVTLDGYKTILLVMGGQASRENSKGFKTVLAALGMGEDLNVPRFLDIPPEPDTEWVDRLVNCMETERPDLVVAIGGGSVMDTAKAAYLAWQTGMNVRDLFGKNVASDKFPGKTFKRVVCFPTTAGTGSEVTPYANIIDRKSGVKRLLADHAIIPAYAFVDARFTESAPEKLTRDTAFDALVHAVESLLNYKAGEKFPEAAEWSVQAVKLIRKALPEVLANPKNRMARELLSAAAVLGGMSIKCCPTSLPHLLSFSVCGKATHGEAVAAFLPHFWRYYLTIPEVRERTMMLSPVFPGNSPEEIVDSVEQFLLEQGGCTRPGTLTGEPVEWIAKLAGDAAENPMKLESAPRSIRPEECSKVFQEVLGKVWN